MDTFSDIYNESIDVLKNSKFDASIMGVVDKLKFVLQANGPDATHAAVLDELRFQLRSGPVSSAQAKAETILAACNPGEVGFQRRAALINTMEHFYLTQKKGNQSIWVMDVPKRYHAWPYDQLANKTAASLKMELVKNGETFGSANRKMMSDALQLARKWSTDVQIKLANSDPGLLDAVKRWFHVPGVADNDIKASVAVLLTGFKKITNTCNSTSVIFSDRPHLRTSGTYDDTFASVNPGDNMPVIYIYQLFLETGRRNRARQIPRLWFCALTVLHELSHKLVNTDDIMYDDDGLKPGPGFSSKEALNNADSWAYFAADVVGVLTADLRKQVLS